MKFFKYRNATSAMAILLFVCTVMLQQPASATLFGQGDFGDSTFGSQSSLSLAFSGGSLSDGNVNFALTPSGGNFDGNGNHVVTVTTNDAVGYRLYAYAPTSTNLTFGSYNIAASGNSSPSTLSANTWGFNLTGSTSNFQGMLSTPTEIKVTTEPYTSGDPTTVTYGVKTDITKPAGKYSGNIVYTAAARFED
jgi:hypothetical protein